MSEVLGTIMLRFNELNVKVLKCRLNNRQRKASDTVYKIKCSIKYYLHDRSDFFLSMSIMNERFESIATLWLHGLNTAQGRSVARILMKLGYILHSTSAVPLSKLYVTYMVYQFRALVPIRTNNF